jgi:hypothetical protein
VENRDVVQEHALRPAVRGAQDFALVVGVDHYPQFRELRGAVADATAFHAWVCHPDGGAVASAHARLIASTPDPPQPIQAQVDAALVELFAAAEAVGGGRLYLYFAGHGAMCADTGDDVALLLATWSLARSRLALSSNGYRSALSSLGLFAEIALFLDCCRVTAANAIGMPPTFSLTPRLPGAARTFVAYATEAGHTAQERPDAGAWRGVFTQRLLAILGRSEHGVHASHLKSLLEHEARMAGQRAHVVDGLLPESTFGRRGTPPLFEVLPDDEHGDLELFDGFGQLVAVHAAINGRWELPLPAGLYKLVYDSDEKELIDHTAPTRLDFRPRLWARLVRTWTAVDTDFVVPPLSAMHELVLDSDSVELVPGVRIRRDGDCYQIEADHGELRFHGRADYLGGERMKPRGTRVRVKQLRDGDLFRCGALRILVGNFHLVMGASLATARYPDAQRSILRLKAAADVAIAVYDAIGREVARGFGNFDSLLPHGLYRVDAELFGFATSKVIEHAGRRTVVDVAQPRVKSPVVIISGFTEHRQAVRHYTIADSILPIGQPPHTSRLLVSVRDHMSDNIPQPMSIHDLRGQRLVDVSAAAIEGIGYWILACAIAPGTYILRAPHDLAITIPAGYNARIFVAATGLRISLAPVGKHDDEDVARAMEHVITTGRLLPGAIKLARRAVGHDLCFAIAATHLTTGDDRAGLLSTLAPFIDVPDVAILHGRVPLAPPLLRASLRLALTDPAPDVGALTADSPLARAACLATGDPFWATWDSAAGTDTWIPATVAALPSAAAQDPVALARRLALPPACIQRR